MVPRLPKRLRPRYLFECLGHLGEDESREVRIGAPTWKWNIRFPTIIHGKPTSTGLGDKEPDAAMYELETNTILATSYANT